MPVILRSATARGGAIGWADPSYTEVALDTTGADLCVLIYSSGDLHANDGPLYDSKGNTWSVLSLNPGNEPSSVKIRFLQGGVVGPGHVVRITTPNPGQAHASLELIAMRVNNPHAPMKLSWSPLALFGSSNGNTAIASADGVVMAVCFLQFDTATGSGLAAPSAGWTLIDSVPATAGSSGTSGIANYYRAVVAGETVAVTWAYDSPQNSWAGLIGYAVTVDPVPPPEPPPSPPPPDCCKTTGGGTGDSEAFNPQGWGDAETGGYLPHPICADIDGGPIVSPPISAPPEELADVTQTHVWTKVETVVPPVVGLGPTTRLTFTHALGQPIPDPAAYLGGYKQAKIKSIGTITRSVSNAEGDYVGSQVDIEHDDSDREIRTSIAPQQYTYLMGADYNVYIVSETRRRARGSQSPIFRGLVRNYSLRTGSYLSAQLSIEDYLSSEYGPLGQARRISNRTLTRGLFPHLPVVNINVPQQFILAIVTDRGAWAGDMQHPAEKGMVKLTTVGGRHIGAHYCTELFVCAHAVKSVESLWASNPDQTQRILIPDSDYGSAAFAPGKPGWPFPTPYFDAVDAYTGKTHRYTSVFLAGKYADAHNSGAISAVAGICGVEANGDGSGPLIVDMFKCWQWACDNLIFRKGGYYTGNYLASPQFSDGTPITDSQRFADAQALSARWIGAHSGGRGYKSGFVLDGSMLSKDVMKYFSLSSGARYGWTRAGQFAPFLFDDAQPLTGLRKLRAPFTVRGATAPSYTTDLLANPITYDFDYDPDTDRYRGISIPQRDDNAIDATGGIEREYAIDMRATRYPATALDVASRTLLWRRLPLPLVDIQLANGGTDLELYETVLLSGADGEGNGWNDVPVVIERIVWDPKIRRSIATGTVVGTNNANTAGGGGGAGTILSPVLTLGDVDGAVLGDLSGIRLVA